MPRIATNARSRILERFVLEALGWYPHLPAVGKQAFAVGRHEVGHLASLPDVSVKPEAARHGVDHPFATRAKFAEERLRRFCLRLDVVLTRHA